VHLVGFTIEIKCGDNFKEQITIIIFGSGE